jgi:HPt (histidine-containing phosphotransfer) domain-containing protein
MKTKNNKYIDLDYLKQISNGSNEFISQMITVFMEEIPNEIKNLENHLAKNDCVALKATAHKMKPSFSFMGVKVLEENIHDIETYCAEGKNLDQLPGLVERVKTITEDVIKELEKEKELFV